MAGAQVFLFGSEDIPLLIHNGGALLNVLKTGILRAWATEVSSLARILLLLPSPFHIALK